MRADLWLFALLGLANASELVRRQDSDVDAADYGDQSRGGSSKAWRPKTSHPEFFSLKVDETPCSATVTVCTFLNFAIRLEKGILIATPYNKWWDPKLPIMFVDDDTQFYTVSKKPLQFYVDSVTGAVRYTPVGWLPPNSIATGFYHTGNNPLGITGPSPAHISWPAPVGLNSYALGGESFWLCPLGLTGQYQVFVAKENFGADGPAGVVTSGSDCKRKNLAAVNANPWTKGSKAPY